MKATKGKVPQIAPGLLPGVGIDQLQQLKCKCGSILFLQCNGIYLASALQSTASRATLVQLPQGFICTSCGAQNNFNRPDQEQEQEPSNHVKN